MTQPHILVLLLLGRGEGGGFKVGKITGMTISQGIIIFLIAVIALLAEFLLYLIISMAFSFPAASGGAAASRMMETSGIFIILWIITAAIGIFCPIYAIIRSLIVWIKNRK